MIPEHRPAFKQESSKTFISVDPKNSHMRWDWKPCLDDASIVNYVFIVVDKNPIRVIENIEEKLKNEKYKLKITLKTDEYPVKDSNLLYCFGVYNSWTNPKNLRFEEINGIPKIIVRDKELLVKKNGLLEAYVDNIYRPFGLS